MNGTNITRVCPLDFHLKYASDIISNMLKVQTTFLLPLVLKCHFLTLDPTDNDLGGVLGNDLIVVKHLKFL